MVLIKSQLEAIESKTGVQVRLCSLGGGRGLTDLGGLGEGMSSLGAALILCGPMMIPVHDSEGAALILCGPMMIPVHDRPPHSLLTPTKQSPLVTPNMNHNSLS